MDCTLPVALATGLGQAIFTSLIGFGIALAFGYPPLPAADLVSRRCFLPPLSRLRSRTARTGVRTILTRSSILNHARRETA